MTSVFKLPLYISKPNYYQCDNLLDSEKPYLIESNNTHYETNDDDDISLYRESFLDIEPNTGVCLRAAQKLMVSALLESDELFEYGSKFIPIYYIFRSGNFSLESVKLF